MTSLRWKEEEINSSSLNAYTKSILNNEINSVKDDTSSLSCYDASNYHAFKETYIREYNAVKRLYPDLVDFIDGLETTILKKAKNIRLPLNTDDKYSLLLNSMENLVISLEDRDLINEYAEITNSDKHYLDIKSTTDENLNFRQYVGRCISEDSSKDTFISLYTNNDLTDFTNLAHEFGHALEHRLFFEERNPIMKYFLSEVSSLYFELLMMDQVNKDLGVSSAKDYLMSNKLIYINRNILVNQMSLFILFHNRFDLNLLKDFYGDKIGGKFQLPGNKSFYLSSYIDTINYITSYMIALKLYEKTIKNRLKGFDTYKDLMLDPTDDLIELLNTYDLNFMENNAIYDQVLLNSELAYKKLIKR